MIWRIETGLFYVFLFTIAMGLHFILTDNHFSRYFSNLFDLRAHAILLASLLLGCVVSLWVHSMSVYVAAVLMAFLSGFKDNR